MQCLPQELIVFHGYLLCFLPRPNAKTPVSEQKDRDYLASRMSRFSSCWSEPVACSCTQKLAALACFLNTYHPLVPTSDCLWESAGGAGLPININSHVPSPGTLVQLVCLGPRNLNVDVAHLETWSAGPGKAWSLCSLRSVLAFQSRNRNLEILTQPLHFAEK